MKLFSRKAKEEQQPDIEADITQTERLAAAENKPKKSKPKSLGTNLRKLAISASLAASLVILGTSGFVYLQFDKQVASQQQLKIAAKGERIAAHLTGRLNQLTGQVVAIANDPAVIEAARQGEAGSEELSQRLTALTSFFPDVLRVRIVRPNQTEPDDSTTPSLSYACLDLVRQAEQGGKPQVEVHKFSTPDQHIDLVGLIRDGNHIIGSLVVSLDVTVMANWIKSLLPPNGQVELRQKNGDLLLNAQGVQGLKNSYPGHVAQVNGTAWEIHFWQQVEKGIIESGRMNLVLVILVAIVLVALVVIVSGARADRMLNRDLEALMTLVIGVMRKRPPKSIAVRLTEFRKAVMALDQAYKVEVDASMLKKPESGIEVSESSGQEVAEEEQEELTAPAEGSIEVTSEKEPEEPPPPSFLGR